MIRLLLLENSTCFRYCQYFILRYSLTYASFNNRGITEIGESSSSTSLVRHQSVTEQIDAFWDWVDLLL